MRQTRWIENHKFLPRTDGYCIQNCLSGVIRIEKQFATNMSLLHGSSLKVMASPTTISFTTYSNFTLPLPNASCLPEGTKAEYPEPPNTDFLQNVTSPFNKTEFPVWEVGLKTTFYVIAMLLAIVGNLLVLLTIAINTKMHKTTFLYIANLAISDLMVGCFNMWVHLGISISADWPFSDWLCFMFPFFQIFALTASCMTLTTIAAVKFFSIVHPIKFHFIESYKHAIALSTTWIIALLVALPMCFVRQTNELIWKDRHMKWCEELWPRYATGKFDWDILQCTFYYPGRQAYYTLQVIVLYFIPVIVMAVAYVMMLCTLFKREPPGHRTDILVLQQRRTKRKVIIMFVIVFVAFVICWTPQQILVFYSAHWPSEAQNIPGCVLYTTIYIAYFNSSLNPVLYAGLNENFRRGMIEIFSGKRSMKNAVHPEDNVMHGRGSSKTLHTDRSMGSPSSPSTHDNKFRYSPRQMSLQQQQQPSAPSSDTIDSTEVQNTKQNGKQHMSTLHCGEPNEYVLHRTLTPVIECDYEDTSSSYGSHTQPTTKPVPTNVIPHKQAPTNDIIQKQSQQITEHILNSVLFSQMSSTGISLHVKQQQINTNAKQHADANTKTTYIEPDVIIHSGAPSKHTSTKCENNNHKVGIKRSKSESDSDDRTSPIITTETYIGESASDYDSW